MNKFIFSIPMLFLMAAPTFANDIYIAQIGDNLDLDIVQDGSNNVIGTSTTDVTLDGDDMTFSITQQGDSNTIAAVIKGNNYTGTWSFVGNSNTVDMLCDSISGTSCETVTANITTNGSNNDFTIYTGESADAQGLVANFTIDGDGNTVTSNVDGTSVALTLVSDNSASAAASGNTFTIDIDGNGDVLGHTINMDVTGGGSTYNITQSGIGDNMIDATFSGDNQNVDITQSD
tara:strand:- start:1311 stop:2006 length:696 start_codon:yes stop_codon:yes gene_type:complete